MGSGKKQKALAFKELQARSQQRTTYMVQIERYLHDTGIEDVNYISLREYPMPEIDRLLEIAEAINKKEIASQEKRMSKRDKKQMKSAFGAHS